MRRNGRTVLGAAIACPAVKAVSLMVPPSSFAWHFALSELKNTSLPDMHAARRRVIHSASVEIWQGIAPLPDESCCDYGAATKLTVANAGMATTFDVAMISICDAPSFSWAVTSGGSVTAYWPSATYSP